MLKKSILIGFAIILFPAFIYASDWELTLDVSIPYTGAEGEVAKNRLIAGINQTATDGPDNIWDTPGFFTDILRAYFLHSDFPGSRQYLWRDIRADHLPQEWELLVQPSQAGVSVTLGWSAEALSNLPPSIRLRLVDLDNGDHEVDMRTVANYIYAHADPAAPHHFRLIADALATPSPPPPVTPPPSSSPPVKPPPQTAPAALKILSEQLLPGVLHRSYAVRLEGEGGTVPYRWKMISGKFPKGLRLGTTTGTISGKPARLGRYKFTIRITDAHGQTVQKTFTISITRRPMPAHQK
jgi:hypothetical protein